MGAAQDHTELYKVPSEKEKIEVSHVARDPCGRMVLQPTNRIYLEKAANGKPPTLHFKLDREAEFVAFPAKESNQACQWCFLVDRQTGRHALWNDRFLSRMLTALCNPQRTVHGELWINHPDKLHDKSWTRYLGNNNKIYRVDVRPEQPALLVGQAMAPETRTTAVLELEDRNLAVKIAIGPVPDLHLLGFRMREKNDHIELFIEDIRINKKTMPVKPGVDLLPALTESVGRALSTCGSAPAAPMASPMLVQGSLVVV